MLSELEEGNGQDDIDRLARQALKADAEDKKIDKPRLIEKPVKPPKESDIDNLIKQGVSWQDKIKEMQQILDGRKNG